MKTFTAPELQNQIIQIEAEKQNIIDLVRNTHFMDGSSKHFICTQATMEYNKRIQANRALIHELEAQNEKL